MNYKLKRMIVESIIDGRKKIKEYTGVVSKMISISSDWLASLGISESDWRICIDEANEAEI